MTPKQQSLLLEYALFLAGERLKKANDLPHFDTELHNVSTEQAVEWLDHWLRDVAFARECGFVDYGGDPGVKLEFISPREKLEELAALSRMSADERSMLIERSEQEAERLRRGE